MGDSIRQRFERWRLHDLLRQQPGLALMPVTGREMRLAGTLAFEADAPGRERIKDGYALELAVPVGFPDELPDVWETGGRIPADYHKLTHGALCLGSPTRQRLELVRSPTLLTFVNRCVVPYLYGFSYRERHREPPFGELGHGLAGIRQDFAALFGVVDHDAAEELVRLASLKKRIANKCPFPCGSKARLGRCHHVRVNQLRGLLGRRWFGDQYRWLASARPSAWGRALLKSLKPSSREDA